MKRLLVTLDEEVHDALKKLAFNRSVSIAQLVRLAIDQTFEDELDTLIGEARLQEHLRDPSGSMTIEEYMESRGIAVPHRSSGKDAARPRRAAG